MARPGHGASSRPGSRMPLLAPESIESARLSLRIVQRSDLPALLVVNGDPQVTRFLPYPTWSTLADGEAWFERMHGIQAGGAALQFVVIERQKGEPVGTCLLFRYDEGSRRAELGYVLGRAYWGRGYMLEALHALLTHAFESMGLRRVEAEVNPANVPSTRLLERIGFVQEGVLRQRWVDAGQPYDVCAYGLLRHEYRAAR